VASGVVSFALGTDTGGSGRIPAAMNNIVGVKPTLGLVSGTGLIYNNRYFDCVPVFARSVEDGYRVLEIIRGYDETDPFSREDADAIPLAPRPLDTFTFGIPADEHLRFFGDELAREAWHRAVEAMEAIGGTPVKIDFSIFVEAGRLPFDSGLLAERAVSYGDLVGRRPETVHPAVAAMIRKALTYTGTQTFEAVYRMMEMRREVKKLFRGIDVLVTPRWAAPIPARNSRPTPSVRTTTSATTPTRSARWTCARWRCRRRSGRTACRSGCRWWDWRGRMGS